MNVGLLPMIALVLVGCNVMAGEPSTVNVATLLVTEPTALVTMTW